MSDADEQNAATERELTVGETRHIDYLIRGLLAMGIDPDDLQAFVASSIEMWKAEGYAR